MVHLTRAQQQTKNKDEDIVSLQQLQTVFNTPAWSGLNDPTSKVRIFLSLFETEPSSEEYDIDDLIMIGLLYCKDQSRPKEKGIAFYNLLQEGGMEKHSHLSSKDKDFKNYLDKMF